MADSFVISDTTYAGEAAAQFVMPAITGADTVESGSIYIKDGIKKKFTIPRWNADYTGMIQTRRATPTSAGTQTIDAQSLTPADYMIYMEFNPRDFETHWYSQEMAPTLLAAELPYNTNSVVVMGVMQRHAKYFNKALWVSSIASPPAVQNANGDYIFGYINGLLQKLYNGGGGNNVVGTTLSAANIIAQLQLGYDAIPLALRFDPSMKIYVSYKTYTLYTTAQQNQTYKGVDITKEGVDEFIGKKMVRIADFPDDTYVIAKGMPTTESNIWGGINSVSDEGLQFAKLQNNSEMWFVKLLMKLDVNFAWYNEAVYYGPAVV